ncbi:MAG: hypothetical protein WBW80_12200 [Acidimicrobiales bacterium]|jgi:hypothetical protein
MRWRQTSLDAMVERLGQLGAIGSCKVCGSGTMQVRTRPVEVEIGGSYRAEARTGEKDPEASVLFLVMVECDLCGHALFFNSPQLSGFDEKLIVRPDQEESPPG